jgi:hypothetical protein
MGPKITKSTAIDLASLYIVGVFHEWHSINLIQAQLTPEALLVQGTGMTKRPLTKWAFSFLFQFGNCGEDWFLQKVEIDYHVLQQ